MTRLTRFTLQPDNTYKCSRVGDNSGHYVTMAQYEQLAREWADEYAQVAEYMLKLEGLASRLLEMDYASPSLQLDEFRALISEFEKALRGEK